MAAFAFSTVHSGAARDLALSGDTDAGKTSPKAIRATCTALPRMSFAPSSPNSIGDVKSSHRLHRSHRVFGSENICVICVIHGSFCFFNCSFGSSPRPGSGDTDAGKTSPKAIRATCTAFPRMSFAPSSPNSKGDVKSSHRYTDQPEFLVRKISV